VFHLQADFLAKRKPKGMAAQFAAGERDEVPFAIIVGSDELKAGLVTVKQQRWQIVNGVKSKIESDDKGEQIKRSELVEWIRSSPVYQLWKKGKMIDV
jgi:histidyl-tRNA synthetase